MLSERIKKLKPYVPGEQPQDRRYIKLNTNENPYPPTPRIAAYLDVFDIERLRLYPDPVSAALREAIAERYGIHGNQVFVGNGSDEVLSFAFYAFFDSARGPLLFPEFTYSFYPVYCDFYGIAYKKVPLKGDFSIDIEAYLKEEASCGIIFPNPNAPTGILLSLDEVTKLLEGYPEDRAVMIDEAYIDFGGESAVSLIDRFKNLLIARTYSKSMCLAGLRLGFAMGDERLIGALSCAKDSFNSYPTDLFAQQIGAIAMKDRDYYEEIARKIIRTRDKISQTLADMGWDVLPSGANFVFAGKAGVTGQTIYHRLKEEGILVRYFHVDGIKNFVRITIGTDEQMTTLIDAVGRLF